MKKLIYGVLLVVMCGMWSCKSENDPFDDGNYRLHREKEKPMMKTVKMSFGGDFITESEEPLLRAEESHTYKAVNVYCTEDKEGATEEFYAYGLFVDSEAEIDLYTGYKYRFEATIVEDDRDKVELFNGKYYYPFRLMRSDNGNPGTDFDPTLTDKFIYAEEEKANNNNKGYYHYFTNLTLGEAYVDLAGDRVDQYNNPVVSKVDYPRVKRFYGELNSFDLSENNYPVEISMSYCCFGIKIVIDKLPFGSLTVEDVTKDDRNQDKQWQSRLLFPKDLKFEATDATKAEDAGEKPSYQGLFSMHSMTAESASFTLKFTWDKGDGLSSKTFTRNIEVHPKKNLILTLDLTGDAHEINSGGNIVFIMGDENLDSENMEIKYDENDQTTWNN